MEAADRLTASRRQITVQFSRKHRLWYAFPIVAWAIAEMLNRLVLNQHMKIVFAAYQFLDPNALKNDLFRSILLLHSQPPMLNVAAGIILKLSALSGLSPEWIANVLFATLGLATGLLLFYLTWRWTGSRLAACISVASYYANPSYYGGSQAGTGRNEFFYEFALQPVLLLVIASASAWLARPDYRSGIVFLLAVSLVVNTRTLFHPVVWGLISVMAVMLPYALKYRRMVAIFTGCALLLVLGWAIKNYILFGIFTPSSLDGYNLGKGFAYLPEPLGQADLNSKLPDATELLSRFPRIANWNRKSLEVVTSGTKGDIGPNWNNLYFITTRHEALARAIEGRKNWPVFRDHLIFMYKFVTRQMYLHPYAGTAFGAYPDEFTGYLWLYDRALFSPVYVKPPHSNALYWTVFAFFILPALLFGALVYVAFSKGNRIGVGLLTYTAFFPVISALLSDGYEGNRMRHSTYPLMILLAVTIVVGACKGISAIKFLKTKANQGANPS